MPSVSQFAKEGGHDALRLAFQGRKGLELGGGCECPPFRDWSKGGWWAHICPSIRETGGVVVGVNALHLMFRAREGW